MFHCAFQLIVLAVVAAVARAGYLGGGYGAAPIYSYAATAPVLKAAPSFTYAATAPVVSYAGPKVIATAPVVSYATPKLVAAAPVVKTVEPVYHSVPQYSFSYGVKDPHTGDSKTAQETRSGDVVQGSYSLSEPDGTVRTVHYQADHVNGFQAVVERTPAVVKTPVYAAPAPVAVKTLAAPAVYAAPAPLAVKTLASPAVYAAPAPLAVKTLASPAVYAAPAPVAFKTLASPAVYAAPAPVAFKTLASPAVYAAPTYGLKTFALPSYGYH
ncbi:hypothetical protein ANN_13470 [Periplaneta americana]|uniref:Cuticle protein n=1 Tax=Periplaneta americana TaxID=6978 RepID=A0ABQ8TJI4_PERAM|nr:hypothetical protein ANN_13470 [Periplaneta americana]